MGMPIPCARRLVHAQATAASGRRCFAGWRRVLLLLAFGIGVQVLPAQSVSVTLAWNPSPSSGVSGYRVYLGNSSGIYASVTDAGSATSLVLPNLAAGVSYYAAVTAYDADGSESGFSNEIIFAPLAAVVPELASLRLNAVPGAGMMLSLNGPADRTYDLQASTNLRDWTVIGVVSLDDFGEFDFVDPAAANFPMRFYRAVESQPSVLLHLTVAQQVVVTVNGQNGAAYQVQASTDLSNWAAIGTVTLDASGTSNFTDVNAANYPARFYRTQQQ